MSEIHEVTWRDIATRFPEFVEWIVQKYGPLPDGPVAEADYERFAAVYAALS